jgi:hypothetical protein
MTERSKMNERLPDMTVDPKQDVVIDVSVSPK